MFSLWQCVAAVVALYVVLRILSSKKRKQEQVAVWTDFHQTNRLYQSGTSGAPSMSGRSEIRKVEDFKLKH